MASNITTLVEKAKLGDADAFSTLYQMYYPKMKGIWGQCKNLRGKFINYYLCLQIHSLWS